MLPPIIQFQPRHKVLKNSFLNVISYVHIEIHAFSSFIDRATKNLCCNTHINKTIDYAILRIIIHVVCSFYVCGPAHQIVVKVVLAGL